MPATKTCSRCGETKSRDDFYSVKTGPSAGRIDSACKRCVSASKSSKYAARRILEPSREPQTCRDCNTEKPADEFGVDGARPTGRKAYCNPCVRRRWIVGRYGITVEVYEAMLALQGGVCAICRRPERRQNRRGQVKPLSIDHDHGSGEVRGLLCDDCNGALGKMNDDPQRLVAAADYLTTRAASAHLAASHALAEQGGDA